MAMHQIYFVQVTGNPAIDSHIRLEVRIIDHTFDILRVHFDCKVSSAKYKYPDHSQSSEKSI
jgi:hypothetical protein